MGGCLAAAAVPAIEFMEPFATQERTMGMTATTQKLLEQVADWPEEDQEELAELAREIEARRTGGRGSTTLTPSDRTSPLMPLTITTWNINSVRLRIDLVAKFLKAVRPDVLCLQETKCPDDAFPRRRFRRLGYEHIALNGQKGYHGVVVVSRLPFECSSTENFCGKSDCRHVAAVLGTAAGLSAPLTLHNFYIQAGAH